MQTILGLNSHLCRFLNVVIGLCKKSNDATKGLIVASWARAMISSSLFWSSVLANSILSVRSSSFHPGNFAFFRVVFCCSNLYSFLKVTQADQAARGSSDGSSVMKRGQRVQVSSALGVLIPEMASMTDDLPVDCSPMVVSQLYPGNMDNEIQMPYQVLCI